MHIRKLSSKFEDDDDDDDDGSNKLTPSNWNYESNEMFSSLLARPHYSVYDKNDVIWKEDIIKLKY